MGRQADSRATQIWILGFAAPPKKNAPKLDRMGKKITSSALF